MVLMGLALTSCSTSKTGIKSIEQRHCVDNLIGQEKERAKILHFFENSSIRLEKCSGAAWLFRFSDYEVSRPYVDYVTSFPISELLEFDVLVTIEGRTKREVVVSKIEIEADNEVQNDRQSPQ
jgi:hypothetical protein